MPRTPSAVHLAKAHLHCEGNTTTTSEERIRLCFHHQETRSGSNGTLQRNLFGGLPQCFQSSPSILAIGSARAHSCTTNYKIMNRLKLRSCSLFQTHHFYGVILQVLIQHHQRLFLKCRNGLLWMNHVATKKTQANPILV